VAFKKGDKNINRSGRAKKEETLTEILRSTGEELINPKDYPDYHDKKSITYKKAVALKWWRLALKNDDHIALNAIIALFRRIDGRERETVETITSTAGINLNDIESDELKQQILEEELKKLNNNK
jgi:hypothetical protein